MAQIKEEIEQGSYRIDPQAVADAILRRIHEPATDTVTAPVTAPAQNECS